jgi:L-methionine (R)-S-oxide reductase
MLDEATNEWLRALLGRHKAVAGTVHVVRGDMLTIAGAINIPPKVQEVTAKIPIGKGMAGLAWQHDKPIQTCNLKDDNTGAVKPGAKAVDAKAAVALPIHDGSGTVRAVVGLAWMHDNELTRAELDAIASDAASLP